MVSDNLSVWVVTAEDYSWGCCGSSPEVVAAFSTRELAAEFEAMAKAATDAGAQVFDYQVAQVPLDRLILFTGGK